MYHEILNEEGSEPSSDRESTTSEIQRRIVLLAMDWDSLTDDEKLEAFPGLGYN
jgi:hypothetical protein